MSARYLYRVVTSSNAKTSNPDWSEKNANDFAKHAIRAGTRGACVQRARKYAGGLNRGEFSQRRCFGHR